MWCKLKPFYSTNIKHCKWCFNKCRLKPYLHLCSTKVISLLQLYMLIGSIFSCMAHKVPMGSAGCMRSFKKWLSAVLYWYLLVKVGHLGSFQIMFCKNLWNSHFSGHIWFAQRLRSSIQWKYNTYTDLILQKKDLTWAQSNRTPATETKRREKLIIC